MINDGIGWITLNYKSKKIQEVIRNFVYGEGKWNGDG